MVARRISGAPLVLPAAVVAGGSFGFARGLVAVDRSVL